MPSGFRTPIVLEGRHIRLVPLSLDHLDGLHAVATDPMIWEYNRSGDRRERSALQAWIEEILRQQAAGETLAFAQIDPATGSPEGMTRFLTIERADSHVEIGGTWLNPRRWRTPVNTESKYLLLRYAFEDEGCHRVEFKTDLRNLRSQRAIERLGATCEGISREHIRLVSGFWRSSVRYGILASEWPAIRRKLEGLLERPWPPAAGRSGATPVQ